MANASKNRIVSFYRIIKAERGHQFAGLYAVEKVYFKDGVLFKKEIVHEWDIRIISESILARMGGQDAYESFKMEHELDDSLLDAKTAEADARTAEDLALNKTKLKKELKLKPEVE
jgi:hypothetical protein